MFFAGCLILLLLLPAAGAPETSPLHEQARSQPATAREVCRGLQQLRRAGKFFGARCRYYANSDASFQSCRLRLAGDVEPNPGPVRRPLTVLCQNVRSVRNKLHTLRALALDLSSHDVFCMTETWLSADVLDSELQLGWNHHTWFRRDRPTHGGGVACAVRTQLCPVRRPDLEPDAAEVLVVELGVNCTTFVVVCYRPPDRDRDIGPFFECVAERRATGKPVIACGDSFRSWAGPVTRNLLVLLGPPVPWNFAMVSMCMA